MTGIGGTTGWCIRKIYVKNLKKSKLIRKRLEKVLTMKYNNKKHTGWCTATLACMVRRTKSHEGIASCGI